MKADLEYKQPTRTYWKDYAHRQLDRAGFWGRREYRNTRVDQHNFGQTFNLHFPELVEALKQYRAGKASATDTFNAFRSRGFANYRIESMMRLPGLTKVTEDRDEKFNSGEWKDAHFGPGFYDDSYGCFPGFKHHYLHISLADPTQVAYYQTVEHLMQGRETRVKPGRYLTRYFEGKYDKCQIKAFTEFFLRRQAPAQVQFARTKDEIIRVIAEGPTDSCMSNGFHSGANSEGRKDYGYWAGHVHPAAVYGASGDFEVGYLEEPDGDGGVRVTARVICNAKKKLMARCYGDLVRLREAMEALGYTSEHGALVGCRLEKIRDVGGDGWIMPYVDAGTGSGGGNLYAYDNGQWWVLSSDSDNPVNTYDGYDKRGITLADHEEEEEENLRECDDCGDDYHEDDMRYIDYNDHTVCEGCCDNNYTFAYGRRMRQLLVPNEDAVYCESDGEHYVAEHASANNVFQCEVTHDWYSVDDLASTSMGLVHVSECVALDVDDSEGNSYAYKRDVTTTCDGRTIHKDDAITTEDGRVLHTDDNEDEIQPTPQAEQAALPL